MEIEYNDNYPQDQGFDLMDDDRTDDANDYYRDIQRFQQFRDSQRNMKEQTIHPSQSLIDLNEKIHREKFSYENEKIAYEDRKAKETPRYFSVGYDANVDEVDQLEISRWQSHFPYLMIHGHTITSDINLDTLKEGNQDGIVSENVIRYHYPIETENNIDLELTGKKMIIHSIENPPGEEIEIQNGILAEIEALDYKSDEEIDPEEELILDEVQVSDAFDQLWPQIVKQLAPLVRKTIEIGNKKNISRNIEDLLQKNVNVNNTSFEDDFW